MFGAVRVTESNGLAGLNENFEFTVSMMGSYWSTRMTSVCSEDGWVGCVEGIRNQPSLVSAEWAPMAAKLLTGVTSCNLL